MTMFETHKLKMKATSGLRTFVEQWEIFGKGRKREKNGVWIITDPAKVVTYAQPGTSFHNYGLALDSCFAGPDPYLEKMTVKQSDFFWEEWGRFVSMYGLTWGGVFKNRDLPHCQISYGISLHELQSVFEFGGIKGVFRKCDKVLQKWS